MLIHPIRFQRMDDEFRSGKKSQMNQQQKDQFDRSSDDDLRAIVRSYNPDLKEHRYCRMLLDFRAQERMEARIGEVSDRVRSLGRPEWKTLTFWIVLLTLLVASAALLRDVVDWTVFGFDSPAPTHQPQEPMKSAPESQPPSTVSPDPSSSPQAVPPSP